jgi:hypothetical protein
MPRYGLNTHVATQAADQSTETFGIATPFINEVTLFKSAFIFTDPYLCQLEINNTRAAEQRQVCDLALNVLINRSLVACHRVDNLSTPITTVMNNGLI